MSIYSIYIYITFSYIYIYIYSVVLVGSMKGQHADKAVSFLVESFSFWDFSFLDSIEFTKNVAHMIYVYMYMCVYGDLFPIFF